MRSRFQEAEDSSGTGPSLAHTFKCFRQEADRCQQQLDRSAGRCAVGTSVAPSYVPMSMHLCLAVCCRECQYFQCLSWSSLLLSSANTTMITL